MKTITLPNSEEYSGYYDGYIQRAIPREDIFSALSNQIEEIKADLGSLTNRQGLFRDAPKEWSIKEVIGHINDVERFFSYRILCISRNDMTPLPGMDQDEYVREAGYDNYLLADLIAEFELLRCANIRTIQNMPDSSAYRRGTASGYPVSVRALIYMLVGHVDHHITSLHEKYLSEAVKL